MKGETLGTYRFDVVADASQYKRGMNEVRKENALVRRTFKKTETATERLTREQHNLTIAYKKGKLPLEHYQRRMKQIGTQLDAITAKSSRLSVATARLTKMRTGFIATAAALGTVAVAGHQVHGRMKEIAKLGERADSLGMKTEDLQAFTRAFGRLGRDAETTFEILQEGNLRAAEAFRDGGEPVEALKLLNVQARDFIKLDLAKQFQLVTTSMQKFDRGTQLSIISKLYGGTAEDAFQLFQDPESVARALRELRNSGGILSRDQINKSQETVKIWRDAMADWNASMDKFAVEMAPLVRVASKLLPIVGAGAEVAGSGAEQALSNYEGQQRTAQRLGERAMNALGWMAGYGTPTIGNKGSQMSSDYEQDPMLPWRERRTKESLANQAAMIEQQRKTNELLQAEADRAAAEEEGALMVEPFREDTPWTGMV